MTNRDRQRWLTATAIGGTLAVAAGVMVMTSIPPQWPGGEPGIVLPSGTSGTRTTPTASTGTQPPAQTATGRPGSTGRPPATGTGTRPPATGQPPHTGKASATAVYPIPQTSTPRRTGTPHRTGGPGTPGGGRR